MSGRQTTTCFILIMLCHVCTATAQRADVKGTPEPTFFSEDMDPNPFWDSDTLPANVLEMLKVGKSAGLAADRLKGFDQAGFAALFDAVHVHLGNSRELGYVVVGKFPMSGADCDWFWVVRSDRDHPKIILFSNSNAIELLRGRTNGYRNVRSTWSSAAGYTITCVYHYDGNRYRVFRKYEKTEK